jgi:hypothetical protein
VAHETKYVDCGGYKVARVKVPRGSCWVSVFSDLQVGHPNFDERVLDNAIRFAKENDAVCIGLGDWLENGTKGSVGKSWNEQTMSPSMQRKWLVAKFKPIAKQFVAICPGNHDLRGESETDNDPLEWVSESLGVEYFRTEIFAVIGADKTGGGSTEASYSLYANHSRSASKNSSLMMASMKRDWRFVQADIKVKGHDHHLDFSAEPVLNVCKPNATVEERLEYYILAGSCLRRAGSYATVAPHAPCRVGQIALELSMLQRHHRVEPKFIE